MMCLVLMPCLLMNQKGLEDQLLCPVMANQEMSQIQVGIGLATSQEKMLVVLDQLVRLMALVLEDQALGLEMV